MNLLEEMDFLLVLNVEEFRDTISQSIWQLVDKVISFLMALLRLEIDESIQLHIQVVLETIVHSQLLEYV